MKIFEDAELTKEVKELDFGIVMAGDTKRVTYYLLNDTPAEVRELKPSVSNNEVTIISCPETLQANTSGTIVFEWKSSITVKRGLTTQVDFKFFELYK